MLKSQKGITILTLVFTISVILIIASIVINSSLKGVNEANEAKIAQEITNLRNAVTDRMINYERNELSFPPVGEIIGDRVFEYVDDIEGIDADTATSIKNAISQNYSSETSRFFRIVSGADAIRLGVEGIDNARRYIVDYVGLEVYGPLKNTL